MKKKLWVATGTLLVLLLAVYFVQNTMAKYRKKVSLDTSVSIASWNILVNEESILGKEELTKSIVPVFEGDPYTKEGVLAPGSTGYFDLVIDPTEVDVAFSYQILSEVDPNSAVQDFMITGYVVDPVGGEDLSPYSSDTGITGDFLPGGNPFTIRIYVKWEDDPDKETMDNQQDTSVANDKDAKALIAVKISFTQRKIS